MNFEQLQNHADSFGLELTKVYNTYVLRDVSGRSDYANTFDSLTDVDLAISEYIDEVYDDDEYSYYYDDDYDGQPDEYTEWQDVYGGDDWDHGQYDEAY